MFENDGGGTISVGGTINVGGTNNGGGTGGATVKVNNEIIDGGGTIKAVEQSMAVNKSEKSVFVQSTAVEQSMGVNQSENSIVVGVKGHNQWRWSNQ